VLVASRGLAESREKAQRLILAGAVSVDGRPATKPGHMFDVAARITVKQAPRYVSRGGEKLAAALDHFGLGVAERICLDVGASTGGFTDCLLQRGAAMVIAVDVGRGLLHPRLRNDPRVAAVEGVNARYLDPSQLPCRPSFACVDVSFISLTLVLPSVIRCVAGPADIVLLIKPQFEAGRSHVQKGGVVRDPSVRDEVVRKVRQFALESFDCDWIGCIESPLRGPAGNAEFLAHIRIHTSDGFRK